MKLEHLVSIRITQKEMIEAILDLVEMEMSDHVPNTDKYNRLERILSHVRKDENYAEINSDGEDFILSIDGVVLSEDL